LTSSSKLIYHLKAIQELTQSAKLAQLTVVDNSNVQNSLVAAVSRIESKLQDLSVNVATVNSRKPTFRQTERTCFFCGRRESHAKTLSPAYGNNSALVF
jgi:hypothetical protein